MTFRSSSRAPRTGSRSNGTAINEVARDFNTIRRTFPTVFIANFFGFEPKAYFEAVEGAEAPPVVEF